MFLLKKYKANKNLAFNKVFVAKEDDFFVSEDYSRSGSSLDLVDIYKKNGDYISTETRKDFYDIKSRNLISEENT